MNELLTTAEAAESLGVSARRVRQLIDEGKLEARQVGRDYVIATSSLEGVKVYGKPGRPPKPPPPPTNAPQVKYGALTAHLRARRRAVRSKDEKK